MKIHDHTSKSVLSSFNSLYSFPPSPLQVFAGAVGALAAMTVLSSLLGYAAPALISRTYTHYAATILFLFFGLRMLYEALTNQHQDNDELEEVEKELAHSSNHSKDDQYHQDNNSKSYSASSAALRRIFSPIFLEAFTLTFLAEWGDRSQIATIGLAAAEDVVGVTLGGIVGHALCTGAAVMGGRHLAIHIDEKLVSIFGGILFLLFAGHSFYVGPPDES